ncbi:uncharacterized protein LOC134528958 [Bacillus rossius redtenbacheri]|uniref:uncharacterized protein LOC134528958 n=1 Tax=Bacillus rossius redtenbacheri TaxID=93214 RepID=UPI002FDE3104
MREAADKRKELENQHAEALSQLREKQNELQRISKYNVSTPEKVKSNETIEALQSKIRELEKKTELQHVRHEELLLEMASIKRSTTNNVPSSDKSWKSSRAPANQDIHNSPESENSEPDSYRVDGDSRLTPLAGDSAVEPRGSGRAAPSAAPAAPGAAPAAPRSSNNPGYDVAGARHFSLTFPYNTPNTCMNTMPPAPYSRPPLPLWKSSSVADLASSCRANPHFVTASRHLVLQPPNSLPLSIPGTAPPAVADQSHAHTAHAHMQAPGLKAASPGAAANSEIDRIMAKIDQDNRILAELDKTRSTIELHPGSCNRETSPGEASPTHSRELGMSGPAHACPQPATEQQVSLMSTMPLMPAQQPVFPQYCPVVPGATSMMPSYQQPTPRIMPQIPSVAPAIPAILTTHYDIDARNNLLNGNLPAMYSTYTGQEHGHDNKVVDMLDIPGKGRCYVYIARYSYDPFQQSPNENPEAELAVNAGDYLLVWGNMDEDGFHDGELLDGRRGLVPSNFIQKLVGEDLLEFHQSVVLGLKDCDDSGITNISHDLDLSGYSQDIFGGMKFGTRRMRHLTKLKRIKRILPKITSNNEVYPKLQAQHKIPGEYNYDLEDILEEDDESLSEQTGEPPEQLFFSVLVPAPKQLTLERQLNKSVLIGWNHPPEAPPGAIDSYHVYVDGVLKTTVKVTERPRALVEGVDSTRPHRISVRSVTPNRRTSRDAACTMVIGKDVPLGPTNVRASHVTSTSAVISWLPSNSNHQHVVCVNNVEVRTVKPGVYRHTITGLAPNTVYRVTVKAKNIRAPHFDEKSLFPEERLSSHIDFRTLPKGLPDPPVDIQVEAGPQDGTLLVTWLPVSCGAVVNGTPVTGYAVYADGKKVTDVDSPTGDHALIDINKLLGLNPKQVTVRTKSRDSQSSDSVPTPVPSTALKGRMTKDVMDGLKTDRRARDRYGSAVPAHMRHPGSAGHRTTRVDAHGQIIIETEENLSDKEIYPANHISIPSIGGCAPRRPEITKDLAGGGHYMEDEYLDSRRSGFRGHHQPQDSRGPPRGHMDRGRPPPLPHERVRGDHHQLARRDRHEDREQFFTDSRRHAQAQAGDRGYRAHARTAQRREGGGCERALLAGSSSSRTPGGTRRRRRLNGATARTRELRSDAKGEDAQAAERGYRAHARTAQRREGGGCERALLAGSSSSRTPGGTRRRRRLNGATARTRGLRSDAKGEDTLLARAACREQFFTDSRWHAQAQAGDRGYRAHARTAQRREGGGCERALLAGSSSSRTPGGTRRRREQFFADSRRHAQAQAGDRGYRAHARTAQRREGGGCERALLAGSSSSRTPGGTRRRREQFFADSRRHAQAQAADRGYRAHAGRGLHTSPGARDRRVRWFVALFDYDPTTMSPNPDACEEELPFSEGDAIKIYGEKDADGFYWGECKGRLGYVPHNMVVEVQELPKNSGETGRGQHSHSRDRWGDIYANMPVRKMIALYDYDPQELSPNVDAEVELSFQTGNIIYVYGEMDDDGFYMGELDGVRGLVPSNFLTEAPAEYGEGGRAARERARAGPHGHGPGARGPPPPPRDGRADPRDRRKARRRTMRLLAT